MGWPIIFVVERFGCIQLVGFVDRAKQFQFSCDSNVVIQCCRLAILEFSGSFLCAHDAPFFLSQPFDFRVTFQSTLRGCNYVSIVFTEKFYVHERCASVCATFICTNGIMSIMELAKIPLRPPSGISEWTPRIFLRANLCSSLWPSSYMKCVHLRWKSVWWVYQISKNCWLLRFV